MVDPARRSAARVATLAAVPIAVLVGVLVFWLLHDVASGGDTGATPSPSGPAAAPRPTSSVSVSPPPLSARAALVCRALLARLPDTVRDLPQRPVTAGAEQVAAYGEPPVVLTCGTPQVSRDPTVMPYVVSGVCWYPRKVDGGTSLTTIDREVPLELRVPSHYSDPLQWAAEFAATITDTVPTTATPPPGCR